jgi:hypothetical protein
MQRYIEPPVAPLTNEQNNQIDKLIKELNIEIPRNNRARKI